MRLDGNPVTIHFYDVDAKTRSSLEYGDQQQIGDLLQHFCELSGVHRSEFTFDIWEQEVLDTDTWSGLRVKHKLGPKDAIDVMRK